MRTILTGLLSLARACLGLKTKSEVPAEAVGHNVPLLTGPMSSDQVPVDAFGRSKVTWLSVKSGSPVDVEQMRISYQRDSARILAGLTPEQTEVVAIYLLSCKQVGTLLKSIRMSGKVFKQDELIGQFARAERAYSALGLLPILPYTVNFRALNSLAEAAAQGLIQRRIPGAPITFHAPGIDRHARQLELRFKANAPNNLDAGVR